MAKIKFIWQFFQCVSLLALVGCSSKSVNFSEWVDPAGTQEYTEERRVLTDEKLAKRILVETMTSGYTDDGLLKVQLMLGNLTKKMQSIEYRFDWIEPSNMVFATPSSRWVIKHIYGGDSVAVTGIAPHNSIKDFVFKIKRR